MSESKTCEFCDKRGLPLLLVRDALAPVGSGAPLANELPLEVAPHAAQRTKRILRAGYVNVYDEARKRWDAYFVSAEGYFLKLLQTPGITPIVSTKPFACPDIGHRELASCITVPDPKRATKVWIGFSDVLWTDAVRNANDDVAYRKRHMMVIDVKALLAGQKIAHARPIAELTDAVAEYAMNPEKGKAAFSWTPFKFNAREIQAERLIKEFEAMRPGKGQIITVPDPAGIVQEIALMMKRHIDLFTAKPEYRRNLAASAAISQIETAVRKQGELNEIEMFDQVANEHADANPMAGWSSKRSSKQTAEIFTVTQAQARRSADNAWKKYAKKFDDTARLAWMKSFNEKLTAYDAEFIAPLARNHVTWMKSTPLASYFECNYDREDIHSGLVYTSVLTQCVATTQDKNACATLYGEWLAGDITDTKNLLLQAMVFNGKIVADAVQAATTVSIDIRQIPWDNVFAVYTSSIEQIERHAHDIAARFVIQIAGPLARALGKIADGSLGFRTAVMTIGLIAGHPVVLCDITGSRKQFRAHIFMELKRAGGQIIDAKRLRKEIAAEIKRQQIHGTPIEGSSQRRWLVLADDELIKAMPSGLNPKQRALWLANSLKTVEKIEELNLGRWRAVINTKVRVGVVAGILQIASLTTLIADQEKTLANENMDATLRMYAGISAIAASTSEAIGGAIEARGAQGLRYGQGTAGTSGKFIAKWSGRAGVATGFFLAVLDLVQASKEYREKSDGLVIVSYAASSLVGAGLGLALAFSTALGAAAIPLIGILVLLAIGISILIENIKDNSLQDWLERCPWGSLPAQRYLNMDTEQVELEKAIKG